MSYIPSSGSVVAFQGTVPFSVLSSGSIISVQQGSVATVIVGGSIAANFTPPANQSVSGTVQTDVRGSVAVAIVSGSVAVATGNSSVQVLNFPANQSVSGNIGISGNVTVVSSIAGGIFPISGSVAATVTNFPTTQNISGSVVSFQGTSPWIDIIQGSVATVIIGGSILTSSTPNQSVSGTVGASIVGIPTVLVGGSVAAVLTASTNQSVSGTVGASVIGIAPVTLTANTIPAAASILVGVTANTNGSVLNTTGYPQTILQITSGPGASIAAQVNFEGTVDGTQFVPIQGYNLATNAIASAAGVESNWAFNTAGLQGFRTRVSNWTVGSITARAVLSPSDARQLAVVNATGSNMMGSVVAYQGVVPWAIAGSVAAFQAGTQITSVSGNLTVSSASIAGQVTVVSSLAGGIFPISGSVAATVTNTTLNVSGSVAAFQKGTWKASIASNYTSNTASIVSAIGNLVLGIRNDTMTSVMATGDGFYSPILIGPVGEQVVANAPIHKWVQGTASMLGGVPLTGGSVAVIAAQGTSVFTYITGLHIINAGATTQWLKLEGATSSTIGFAIAPAGGGTNMYFPNGLKTNANGAFTASISGSGSGASVYVTAQGFISKT